MAKDVWDGEDLLSKILIPSDAKETTPAGAVLAWGHVKIFVGDDSPTSCSGHAGSTEAAWNARRSQPQHHWRSAGRLKAELRLSPVEICLAAENRSLQFLPPPTVHFMRSRWSFEFGFLEHTFRGLNTMGNLNKQHQWRHSSVHRLNKCSLKVSTEIHWWAKPASGPAFSGLQSGVGKKDSNQIIAQSMRNYNCDKCHKGEGLWPATAGYLLLPALHA